MHGVSRALLQNDNALELLLVSAKCAVCMEHACERSEHTDKAAKEK